MPLNNLIEQIENSIFLTYFFAQMITIICLFLYGYFYLILLSDSGKEKKAITTILAYPTGLAAFSVIAFVMVTFAIPYTAISVSIGCILVAAVVYLAVAKSRKPGVVKAGFKSAFAAIKTRRGVITLCVVILAAAFACLGFLSVTVSNDSMYNYSFYPRAIVYSKGLKVTFDTFLTDVGQGCALINTLPFLFGFNETFGLQHMLNFSFIGVFFVALSDLFAELSKRYRMIFPGVITLLLLMSLPFVLLSKWVLANDYFTVFMFITAYLASKMEKDERWDIAVIGILSSALSITRIEGGIYFALLILCISVLDYTNKELGLKLLLPVIILHVSYSARIFLTMDITAPYMFLTAKKAVMMVVIMTGVLIYVLLIRGRLFVKLFSHTEVLIMAGLFGMNLLLFLKDTDGYIMNLNAFIENVMYYGGWGILPVTVLAIYFISITREFRFGYWDLLAFSYLLYAIAVTFMREDGLHPGIGDSGNRVMLQVVPLLLFAAASHLPKLIKKSI